MFIYVCKQLKQEYCSVVQGDGHVTRGKEVREVRRNYENGSRRK